MNAVKMLKDDHEKVKGLFRQYEGAGERAHQKKQQLAQEIFTELELHSKLEEEIFYPAAKAKGSKDLKEVVDEGLEEHHVVDTLIQELKAMDLSTSHDQYEAKIKVLIENVEHHIEEEEGELLPEAEKKLGKEVETLGTEMEQRKTQLMQAMSGGMGGSASSIR